MKLTVELTRHEKTRNLAAHVIQRAADKAKRGSNLLAGRKIRRIETAQLKVIAILDGHPIEWELLAAPDSPPPYKSARRRDVARELSS
jgi:hypothetical protein